MQENLETSLNETRNYNLQPRASYTTSMYEQQATHKAKERKKPGKRHILPRRKETKEKGAS